MTRSALLCLGFWIAFPVPSEAGLQEPQAASTGVWAWGAIGQLGDGKIETVAAPSRIAGLPDVIAVSAGGSYSLALDKDGSVWVWWTLESSPTQIAGLTGITAIAASDGSFLVSAALALKKDGTVWGLSGAQSTRRGDGAPEHRVAHVAIPALTDVVAIAARHQHALALRKDGTVWSWGNNSSGQLGDGTQTDRERPVQVLGLGNVMAVEAAGHFSLALKKDGTLWTWGSAPVEGTGASTHRTPVQVPGIDQVTAIAGGYGHWLAQRRDGTVWTWGSWTLMDPPTGGKPREIRELAGASALAPGFSHSLALKRDGTLWAWGWNSHGQLGDGTTDETHPPQEDGREPPVQIAGLRGIRSISAGGAHSLAICEVPRGKEQDQDELQRLKKRVADLEARQADLQNRLAQLEKLLAGPAKEPGLQRAKVTSCANNLSTLWTLEAVYMSRFGGRMKRMPEATGPAFWLALAKTTPPLVEKEKLSFLVCPLTGREPKPDFTTYRGPAKLVRMLGDDDPVGCCEPGSHPDGTINVLKKSGAVETVGPSDALYKRALENTTLRSDSPEK